MRNKLIIFSMTVLCMIMPVTALASENDDMPRLDTEYGVYELLGCDLFNNDGTDVLVVFSRYENTTDENTDPGMEYDIEAFQDGIALESHSFISDDDMADLKWPEAKNAYTDLQPGASIVYYYGFELESNSDVDIEISALWAWDDDESVSYTFKYGEPSAAETEEEKSETETSAQTDVEIPFNNNCIVDETGWIEDFSSMKEDLKDFYDMTGIQPFVYLKAYDESLSTAEDMEDYAEEWYHKNIGNARTFLFICFEENGGEEDLYMQCIVGSDIVSLIDYKIITAFLDCADECWANNLSVDDTIVRSFNSIVEKIMEAEAEPLTLNKTKTNDFNKDTNQVISMGGISFEVPATWTAYEGNTDDDMLFFCAGGNFSVMRQEYDIDMMDAENQAYYIQEMEDAFENESNYKFYTLSLNGCSQDVISFECSCTIGDYDVDVYCTTGSFENNTHTVTFTLSNYSDSIWDFSDDYFAILDSIIITDN